MTDGPSKEKRPGIVKIPAAASIVALLGLADSIYLTAHHYSAEPVPCSLIEGCEMVLSSPYATVGGFIAATTGTILDPGSLLAGFPLAALGAISYFVAFSLAVLAAFGDGRMWKLFIGLAVWMALFTGFLLYVQGALIGHFCQFCLLSALTSFILFALAMTSIITGRKSVA